MESKKKKKIMNVLMVVLILVIALCGVMAVGSFKGWFDKSEEALFVSKEVTGLVNIERKSVGYSLETELPLKEADIIETKNGAETTLAMSLTGQLSLNENSELEIVSDDEEDIHVKVETGEIFVDTGEEKLPFTITYGDYTLSASEGVFSLSVLEGSSAVTVYKGSLTFTDSEGESRTVDEKKTLSVVEKEGASPDIESYDAEATAMNDFAIRMAEACKSASLLCFSGEDLDKVVSDREAEAAESLAESLEAAETIALEEEVEEEETESATEATGESSVASETEETEEQTDGATEKKTTVVKKKKASSSKKSVCTIAIKCDTILDNLDDLDAGKESYVPKNGKILATSKVEFNEGDTVFDVLKRVCKYAGIQLEYSWTPMYNSYYIEGINHLYEFDCGNESGWMYKVNGWFPNYGCSSYTLKDGDSIVWCYTCKGLGKDVGASGY